MKTLASLFACACALLAVGAGCGSSDDDHTLSVGSTSVTVAGDNLPDAMRELIAQAPYRPWFQKCISEKTKSLITPKIEEELVGLSPNQVERHLVRLMVPIDRACEQSGRPYLDPHASPAELEIARGIEVNGVRDLLRAHGVDEEKIACFAAAVEAMSTKRLIALLEATPDGRVRIFEAIEVGCV